MSIIQNKKAFHDFFIEDKYEAGIMLQGWEIKAIRAGRVQLKEAYVTAKSGELFLFGSHISPLTSASTHIHPDPVRTRKLLLHKQEIDRIIGKVQRAGYTLMPLDMHFKGGRVKLEIGLAKGKKQHDKRATEKEKDAKREAAQAMKKERR
jgi:SsrA-binding protein